MSLIHVGMCENSSLAFIKWSVDPSRIVQTLGHASASAGTHDKDGEENGLPFSAAIDLSVNHPIRLTQEQIKELLDTGPMHGFAGWYRNPGHDGWPASDEEHMHFVYVGVGMKSILQEQIHSWCANKTGLVGDTHYEFHIFSQEGINTIRPLFLKFNPL